MMMRYGLFNYLALALALSAAGGCGLSRPYPEKQLFALNAGSPPGQTEAPRLGMLRVTSAWVAGPYDGQAFVYRMGADKMTLDYYNGFVDAPAKLLTTDVARWLAQSGMFAAVVRDESYAPTQYRLETNVTELYSDYTNKQAPAAVMTIRFFLFEESGTTTNVVLDKSYTARVRPANTSPEALAAAFGQALQEILNSFSRDLVRFRATTSPEGGR